MKITDELRDWIGTVCDKHRDDWLEEWLARTDEAYERDATVARDYVKLPVDKDGVPIRVGDKLDGYDTTITVDELVLNKSGWAIVDANFDRWSNPCAFSHNNEPTVEDVLVEMLEKAVGHSDAHATVALNTIAEYADRIREAVRDE